MLYIIDSNIRTFLVFFLFCTTEVFLCLCAGGARGGSEGGGRAPAHGARASQGGSLSDIFSHTPHRSRLWCTGFLKITGTVTMTITIRSALTGCLEFWDRGRLTPPPPSLDGWLPIHRFKQTDPPNVWYTPLCLHCLLSTIIYAFYVICIICFQSPTPRLAFFVFFLFTHKFASENVSVCVLRFLCRFFIFTVFLNEPDQSHLRCRRINFMILLSC